jgi:hypothetical protein
MAIGFEYKVLGEKQFDCDPTKVEERRVGVDTLKLRLRTPVTYAPYKVDVLLGTRENLKAIASETDIWRGEIPLQRRPEFDPDGNYVKGKEPENISEEEALRRYEAVCSQIEAGKYRLHKFDSGKVQVELTDLIF